MNTVAENVVRNYVDWLQQHTEIETMEDGWERITLPFTVYGPETSVTPVRRHR